MAIVFASGFEMGTFGEFYGGFSGTNSIDSTIKYTGSYSFRCNPNAEESYCFNNPPSTTNILRFSFYIYIHVAPDVDCDLMDQTSYAGQERLILTTDRYIKICDGNPPTLRGTSTTQLSLDTWYRISGAMNTDADYAYIWINGTIDPTINGVTTNSSVIRWNSNTSWKIGCLATCTADIYFDDIVFDNIQGSTDLGDIRCAVIAHVNQSTTATFDTPVGSATHYENVDEGGTVAISDADYNQHAGKTATAENYTLDTCSDIGLVGTDVIDAVNFCWRCKVSKVGGTQPTLTAYDQTGTATSTPAQTVDYAWYKNVRATSGDGTAWLQADFDSAEIRISHFLNEANDTFISCACCFVAYHAGAVVAPGNIKKINGLTWATVKKVNSLATASIAHINTIHKP